MLSFLDDSNGRCRQWQESTPRALFLNNLQYQLYGTGQERYDTWLLIAAHRSCDFIRVAILVCLPAAS